ncbi:MAG: FG-GAP repeat protein [Alphaproteobacteria bacterium]|nr:FG-GAP repeat protein [Alphaproteobacteria bacterium]
MMGTRGFSLVELAIVLVIAALVTGAVVAGRSVLQEAKLKTIIEEINTINLAAKEFKTRYGAIPGDMWNAADTLGKLSDGSDPVNGDGDGVLQASNSGGDNEMLAFWQHLALSGLLPGEYDGASLSPGAGVMSSDYDPNVGFEIQLVSGEIFVTASKYTGGTGGGAFLSPEDTWNLDQKYDDGDPATGLVRAVTGSGNSGNCVSGGVYVLDNKGIACRLDLQVQEVAELETVAQEADYADGAITTCPGGAYDVGDRRGPLPCPGDSSGPSSDKTYYAICRKNGVWEPDTTSDYECAVVPQSCPAVLESNANWDETLAGDSASGTCIAGYSGTPTRDCNVSSSWDAITGSCAAACTTPANPANGTSGAATLSGSTWSSTITCDAGYAATGSPRTCTTGNSWSAGSCSAACSTPSNPANGTSGAATWNSGASQWESAVTCDSGYTASGSPSTCTTGNSWTMGSCTAACSTPADPTNGTSGAATWNSGASQWESTVTCDTGYTASGSPSTCTSGSWTMGTCDPACSTPADPVNGTSGAATWNSGASQWESAVSCDSGDSASGSPSTGTSGNSWTMGSCVANGCGFPPSISHVVFEAGTSNVGDTRVAKCDSASWYWGMPVTYTCSNPGPAWTGTGPTCYLLDCSGATCSGTGNPQECTVPATCATKDCSSATPPTAPAGAQLSQSGDGYADQADYLCDTCFGSTTTATGTPDGRYLCDNTEGWKGKPASCPLAAATSPVDLTTLDGVTGALIMGHAGDGGFGQMGDHNAAGVEAAGDVNNDGIEDFIIEAKWSGTPAQDTEVYLIFGQSGATWAATAGTLSSLALDGTDGVRFHNGAMTAVGKGGDFNGDGIDDVLIGAYWADTPSAVYIVFGRSAGAWATLGGYVDVTTLLDGIDGVAVNGPVDYDWTGYDTSNAGDVNDDGIDDILVARQDAYSANALAPFVVFGKDVAGWAATGGNYTVAFNGTNSVKFSLITAGDQMAAVSHAGDANGDGIDDILLGASAADPNGISNSGQTYLVFGKTAANWAATGGTVTLSALNGTTGVKINGVAANDYSAASLDVGNFNGDSIPDILIGAPDANPGGMSDAGRAYVVFGKSAADWAATSGSFNLSTLNGTNGAVLSGQSADDWAGASVANAGDMDGDGIDDIIVGAPGYESSNNEGRGYVVFGKSAADWAAVSGAVSLTNADIIATVPNNAGGGLGYSVAGCDANDDGVSDAIFCAPYAAGNTGACALVFGVNNDPSPSEEDTNGSIAYTYNSTTHVWTASLTCSTAGYTLSGNATSTCTSGNTTWSALGTCAPNCTTPANPANGTSGAATLAGSTWSSTITCDAGYAASGSPRTCTTGNSWSAGSCVSTGCSAPPTIANVVWSGGTTNEGDTQVAKCDSATWYWGMPQTYTCTSGSWTGTSPTCFLLNCSGTVCSTTGSPQECTVPATCAGLSCSTAPSNQTGAVITNTSSGSGYAAYRDFICDGCFSYSGTSGRRMCDSTQGWKGTTASCTKPTFRKSSDALVNTYIVNDQNSSDVIALTGGGYVVTWVSDEQDGALGGVYFQRYDSSHAKVGSETRVNTTTAGDQNYNHAAALATGGFVVTWSGPSGANNRTFFRIYNSSGTAVTAETASSTLGSDGYVGYPVLLANGNFMILSHNCCSDGDTNTIQGSVYNTSGTLVTTATRINTYATLEQRDVKGALLSNGNVAVIWNSEDQDGSGWGVYGQIVTPALAKVGSEFRVNTFVAGDQGTDDSYDGSVTITALSNGNFVAGWMSYGQDGDNWGFYAQIFDSTGAKVGSEFRVNSTTQGIQEAPELLGLANGYFLAVWSGQNVDGDGYGLVGQLFDSSGNRIRSERVITEITRYNQYEPDMAVLANGDVVVDYTHYTDAEDDGFETYRSVLRPFAGYDTPSALAVGGESLVNTYTTLDQDNPALAVLADGGYVVVWLSDGQDGNMLGVYFQRYSSAGAKVGSETQVNTQTVDDQDVASVSGLANGGFVVAWNDYEASIDDVKFRVYDAYGAPVTGELVQGGNTGAYVLGLTDGNFMISNHPTIVSSNDIQIGVYDSVGKAVVSMFRANTTTAGVQKYTDMAQLTGGNVVVTWGSSGQDGSGDGVYGQIVTTAGVKVGSEFRANTTTAGDQGGDYDEQHVAALSNGGFVVVWDTSAAQDGSGYGVYGQVFNSAGTKVGSEFQISTTTTGDQWAPKVTGLPGGYFFVVWESLNVDDDAEAVVGQLFDSTGAKVGGERLINQVTDSGQQLPAVTTLPSGKVLVAWYSDVGDADGNGVMQRVIDPFVPASPLDAPGLKLWLKADVGVTKDAWGVVSGWTDQSGNNNNASQGTTANKPAWVDSQVNGYPAVVFDGINDYMGLSDLTILKNVYGAAVFVVEKRNGAAGGTTDNTLFDVSTNSASNPRMEVVLDGSNAYKISARRSDGNTTATLTGGTSGTASFNLVTAMVDYYLTDAYLYVDGTLANSNTSFLASGSTSSTNSVAVRLGAQAAAAATGFLNGSVAEVLVFNRPMYGTEREAIECYLGRKYNLTLGHSCPGEIAGTPDATGENSFGSNNGTISYSFNGTDWTGTLTCKSGYTLSGSSTNTCTPASGTWGSLGSCSNTITTPATISGLKLWADASDTASITKNGSNQVSQWNDKSGQNNHLTQASATEKPLSGTRTLNGLNVLDFISDDSLATAWPWAAPVSFPITAFLVAGQDIPVPGAGAGGVFIDGKEGATSGGWFCLGSGYGVDYYVEDGPDVALGTVADTNPKLFSIQIDDSPGTLDNTRLYVDGILRAGPANGADPGAALNNLSVGRWWSDGIDGFIGELIIYQGKLSDQDRKRVECYLSKKWAVGVAHSCQ